MSSDTGEQSSSHQPAIGEPFSQVYLRPAAPMKDSQRFRNRLAAYVRRHNRYWDCAILFETLELQMGAKELHNGYAPDPATQHLIKNGEMRDVLDLITYIARYLTSKYGSRQNNELERWNGFVQYVLNEEGLGYA